MKELVIEKVKLHLKKKKKKKKSVLTVSFRRDLEREEARVSYVMHGGGRSQGLRVFSGSAPRDFVDFRGP